MRIRQRLCVFVGVLLLLAAILCLTVASCTRQAAIRRSTYFARLAADGQNSLSLETDQCNSGQLWVGQLHESVPSVAPNSEAAADLTKQRRITGELTTPTASISAQFELHECHPGSKTCAAGGNIVLRSEGKPLATISVGILRAGESRYRVNWPPSTELSEAEKLRALQE